MSNLQRHCEDIVLFLNECRINNWELDSDDIEHILYEDFDYVRKQNIEEGKHE